MIRPLLLDDEIGVAEEMLRAGATRGMIEKQLEQNGLSPRQRGDVLEYVFSKQRSRSRMKGVWQVLGGVTLLSGAAIIFWQLGGANRRTMRIAGLLGFGGLFLLFQGFQSLAGRGHGSA